MGFFPVVIWTLQVTFVETVVRIMGILEIIANYKPSDGARSIRNFTKRSLGRFTLRTSHLGADVACFCELLVARGRRALVDHAKRPLPVKNEPAKKDHPTEK